MARTDQQLLRAYAENRSDAAFAELAKRHVDFIYSAAMRMVRDTHLAKDVSQGVLVALAKDARKLAEHPVLVGWLHRTTRNIASQAVRTEVRRRQREKETAVMHADPEQPTPWDEIAPHLDTVIAGLSESDRDAVLMRYFENRPAHEIAAILGISSEAAQKRVVRAVERLRRGFAKRGVTAATAGLVASIYGNAVQAAPIGLAATLSGTAVSGISASAKLFAMTTLQKSLAATGVALLVATAIYQVTRMPTNRKPLPGDATAISTPRLESDNQSRTGLPTKSDRARHRQSDLERQNAALREQLAEARRINEMAEDQSRFLEEITIKLLGDDQLHVPETVAGLAVLYGQVQLRSRDFLDKWNGRIPPDGTPEAESYRQELDARITDDATLMKALMESAKDDPFKEASDMAQFQSIQLYASLGLDESQWRQLDDDLNGFYSEIKRLKLDSASKPTTGFDEWRGRREEMGCKVFSEIQSSFTPRQQEEFKRLYDPSFLWGLNVGGARPK